MRYFWDDTVGGYCKFEQEAAVLLAERSEANDRLYRSEKGNYIRECNGYLSLLEPEKALDLLDNCFFTKTQEGEAERQALLERLSTEV